MVNFSKSSNSASKTGGSQEKAPATKTKTKKYTNFFMLKIIIRILYQIFIPFNFIFKNRQVPPKRIGQLGRQNSLLGRRNITHNNFDEFSFPAVIVSPSHTEQVKPAFSLVCQLQRPFLHNGIFESHFVKRNGDRLHICTRANLVYHYQRFGVAIEL